MSVTSLKRKLGNSIEILTRIETIFIIVILGIMGLMNTIALFFRIFFNISFIWINPFTLVLFSWLTFIGAAIIFYNKEYIIVEYFVNRFFCRFKKPLALFVNFGVIIFLIFIICEMPGVIKTQTHKLELLPLPTFILSLPILIAVSSILLVFVYRTWDIFDTQRHGD